MKDGSVFPHSVRAAVDPCMYTISDATATEGGTLTFTVTRSGNTAASGTVYYTTENGTALSGSDYKSKTGRLSFSAGQTSKSISISTVNNSVSEATEAMNVRLYSPGNGTLIDELGTGTIQDNDAPCAYAIGDATATEGGTLTFTVTRSGNTAASGTVYYTTGNGTALSGSDYKSKTGRLNFSAGQTSKTISISTVNNSVSEATEAMNVRLYSPGNGTLIDELGTGTIQDNDAPCAYAIGDATATEGGILTFTVTRSGNTAASGTVYYTTEDGTALSGSDYKSKAGRLSFSAGQTSKTISISTVNNSVSEATEAMNVRLYSPSNGTLIDELGTGTIQDDEAPIVAREMRAVLMGVEDYSPLGPSYADLSYCVDDIVDVYNYLQSQKAAQIIQLVDSNATEADLYSALNTMEAQSGPGDNFLFYYSGHGNEPGNVLPFEYTTSWELVSPAELLNEVDDIANKIGDGTVVMVLDSCNSGGLIDYMSQNPAYYDNFVVFTACEVDEYSWDGGPAPNGLFTYWFLERGIVGGEADANRNREITTGEMSSYLVSNYNQSDLHAQIYDPSGGSYVFAKVS